MIAVNFLESLFFEMDLIYILLLIISVNYLYIFEFGKYLIEFAYSKCYLNSQELHFLVVYL